MNNVTMNGAPRFTGPGMAVLALAVLLVLSCLSFLFRDGAVTGGGDLAVAEDLRVTARGIEDSARETLAPSEGTFGQLGREVERFDELMDSVQSVALYDQLSQVEVSWQPVKRAARTLIEAGPDILYVSGIAGELRAGLGPMQQELAAVVTALQQDNYPAGTVVAAQKLPLLAERVLRNLETMLSAGDEARPAVEQFQADAAGFLQLVEALTRGEQQQGIDKVEQPRAVDALSSVFRRMSAVSSAADRVVASAATLRDGAAAREQVLDGVGALDAAVVALLPAMAGQAAGASETGTLDGILPGVPVLLSLTLLAALYVQQRRRERDARDGVAALGAALKKIAGGDLTVRVPENGTATGAIAKEINAFAARQRELIDGIRRPFERSMEEMNRIGISARGQVEKGRELTCSVGESTEAANEMVRTSEGIKSSTADAARTAERNCQQVARGYELTKDMSKASVDVRESVQETSKSAKRQSELIQSVTAAAEYIQTLITKISVVAINTRIEAEKAGEYGRPFLGIAEAIADLLREAGDEGRKIISEVRMLQNMSAENLASMETTVGTVVTILEYIERLDASLEEINSGTVAISEIIGTVDDAAGQSAVSALHMNSTMAEIRERNQEIGKFTETTQSGVTRLQKSMREAVRNLGQFQLQTVADPVQETASPTGNVEPIRLAAKVYREEDMGFPEAAGPATATS